MIARFIRNSFGTAAAEFALTLPMMLFMFRHWDS